MQASTKRPLYLALAAGLGALGLFEVIANGGWTWLGLVFFVLPDLALLAGIAPDLPKGRIHPRAVPLYNAVHSFVGPLLLAVTGLWLPPLVLAGALFWAAHIAMDRGLGFGKRARDGSQRDGDASRGPESRPDSEEADWNSGGDVAGRHGGGSEHSGVPQNGVRLRTLRKEDLPVFFEHQLDPAAVTMAAFPSKDRDAFMAHWDRIMRDDAVVIRTVLVGGAVAGNVVSFMQVDAREVGYWLGREFWGKGVATEALRQFLPLLEQRPLHARVVAHNFASRRVLEKCGFKQTGRGTTSPGGSFGDEVEEVVLRLD